MSSTNEQLRQAKRFLAVREWLELSQQAFADSLDISLRAEQNYERGARRLPAEVLLNLAKVHRVDPLWVLDGPGERPRLLNHVGGVDTALLAKASSVVRQAIVDTKKKVTDEQFGKWVAAVYLFYLENPSGTGAESLIKTLLRV